MMEALLIAWMTAVGVALLAPLWRRLGWAIVGFALPTGAAAIVPATLVVLALGIAFTMVTVLSIVSVIGIGVVAAVLRSMAVSPRALLPGVVTVFAAAALALVIQQLNLTRLTVDSVRYLLTADVLATDGSLDAVNLHDLRLRHLVTPLLHTVGVHAGAGYSSTIAPLFAVSGLAATGWLGWQAFERFSLATSTRWWLLGASALLVVAANRFAYHAFYINGHMFFAVFLLVGAGLGSLAAVERDWRWIAPASLGFAALVPLRPEAVITASIFLVPILVSRTVPYSHRWRLIVPFLGVSVLWNGVVWPTHARDFDLGIAGPVYGNLLIALTVAVGLGLLAWSRVERFAPWGPAALAAGIAAYLGIEALGNSDLLSESLSATGANLAVEGLWGTLWWILPILLVGAWLVGPSHSPTRLLLVPLATYGLALFAFAYLRDGAYRIGTGDSGSRMLMHVVFVAVLVVLTTAAEAATRDRPSSVANP